MIKEEYVSPKVAALLRHAGFSEPCRTYYSDGKDGELTVLHESSTWKNFNSKSVTDSECVSAPTVQMAVKWLEENARIEIDVLRDLEREWGLVCEPNPYEYRIIKDGELLSEYGDFSPTRKDAYEHALTVACSLAQSETPTCGWTDFKTSKRLVELGADIMASDMYYYGIDENSFELCDGNIEIDVKPYVETTGNYTPCWSVGMLMRCMPNAICDSSAKVWRLWADSDGCGYYPVKNGCEKGDNALVLFRYETCGNPVAEMAVWLLEHGYKLQKR